METWLEQTVLFELPINSITAVKINELSLYFSSEIYLDRVSAHQNTPSTDILYASATGVTNYSGICILHSESQLHIPHSDTRDFAKSIVSQAALLQP